MPNKKTSKITFIGGGGKIAGATLFEILRKKSIENLEIVLYGRTLENIENNIRIANRTCSPEKHSNKIIASTNLDEAVQNADIVFYSATSGLQEYGKYKSIGVENSAHILYVAERIKVLSPEAWLLVSTNPTDIPLIAVNKMFGLSKLLGLCNAPLINKKILAAFLNREEEEFQLYDIGVNHEVWFYEILLDGLSIYDLLREQLPVNYNPALINSEFSNSFPEWKLGFINNIEVLKHTDYLFSPVGSISRFKGLPVCEDEIIKIRRRPSKEDFLKFLHPEFTIEDILAVSRRSGAGIPLYIADIIESIITDNMKEHSVQVLNKGTLPAYPDDVVLQMTCRIGSDTILKPQIGKLPDFIHTILASRILQNHMLGRALAEQDLKMMQRSMLTYPERVTFKQVEEVLNKQLSVEPYIPLS